jgi:hypothetical protein
VPKPPLPSQAEIRDYCRATYGHYSNLSREWLKQRTTPADRIAQYGRATIDREMAEDWEAAFLAMSPAEQDPFLDWYASWYTGPRYDRDKNRDPNAEGPTYGLVGILQGTWRPDTCGCRFRVMNETPGGSVTVWIDTVRNCPEHTAQAQALLDAVYGENRRKNGVLSIIEGLATLADREANAGAWAFDSTRIPGTDERVLLFNTIGLNPQQRSGLQNAADVQFGTGTVVIEAG